jgi:hypothetical protein
MCHWPWLVLTCPFMPLSDENQPDASEWLLCPGPETMGPGANGPISLKLAWVPPFQDAHQIWYLVFRFDQSCICLLCFCIYLQYFNTLV